MEKTPVGIPSWSNKTFRARKNYACANCSGIIPIGVQYLRHVERLGARKGNDPLRNIHSHLDCTAPWYQPESGPRLRHVGLLPHAVPPPAVIGTGAFIVPSVSVQSDTIGIVQWRLPPELAQKIAFTTTPGLAVSAITELELALGVLLSALVETVGNQRRSMMLSHLINQIATSLDYIPNSSAHNG